MNLRRIDVFVIGAGPAGLCAALRLGQLGYRVILAERSALWPRPQIGEALTPGVRNIIDLLDANDALEGVPIATRLLARVRWRTAEAEDVTHGDSAVVERARFDAALLALAEKRGIEIMRPARVLARGGRAGAWQLEVGHGHGASRVEARFVIEASGRGNGAGRLDCAPALAATWAEWDAADLPPEFTGTTRVEALETGWLWGTRLPNGSYRIMLLGDPAAQRRILGKPEERLRVACAASMLFCEPAALPQLTDARVCAATPYLDIDAWQPGWIKTGDAAFAIDPVSSTGVEKAMRFSLQAVTAAHTCLQSDDPARQALAGEFFEERLVETCARHDAWTRGYYAEAWCAEEIFWQERSSVLARAGEDGIRTYWRARLDDQVVRFGRVTSNAIDAAEASAPPQRQQSIRFAAGTETVRALCVVDDQVQSHLALVHPRLTRPLAFYEDHALLPALDILRCQPTFEEALHALAASMDQTKALRLLAWLWQQGVVETSDKI